MTSTIRKVVVVGGGSVAFISAIGIQRAMRHLQLEVVLIDTGAEAEAPAGRWTLPSQRGAHAQIGISEADFLRRTGATFKLATEHVGWQGEGSRFLHAHGDIGVDIEGTPFYKYLLARAIAGQAENPDNYSIAAQAARLGRFAQPMGTEKSLTASFTYAFHVDERSYAAYLAAHAQKSGVRRIEGMVAGVTLTESGGIDAVVLASGEQIAGDFFIDCSGRAAHLSAKLAAPPRIDWSAWLPCDRMLSGHAAALAEPPALTRITATSAGWTWSAPLLESTLVGHVYASAFLDDEAALRQLQPAQLRAEPALTRCNAGRREKFWLRNCLALGAAAVEIEPLAGAELHLAQLGLAFFIELFPLDARSDIESAEYNRIMGEHADNLRDFTIAHYRAGRPRDGAFWQAARAASPPAILANKLDLYGGNGRINLGDHESFEETDWAWLLLGSGRVPDALEWQQQMLADKVPPQNVAQLRDYVEKLVSTMPRHIDYLRRLNSAAETR